MLKQISLTLLLWNIANASSKLQVPSYKHHSLQNNPYFTDIRCDPKPGDEFHPGDDILGAPRTPDHGRPGEVIGIDGKTGWPVVCFDTGDPDGGVTHANSYIRPADRIYWDLPQPMNPNDIEHNMSGHPEAGSLMSIRQFLAKLGGCDRRRSMRVPRRDLAPEENIALYQEKIKLVKEVIKQQEKRFSSDEGMLAYNRSQLVRLGRALDALKRPRVLDDSDHDTASTRTPSPTNSGDTSPISPDTPPEARKDDAWQIVEQDSAQQWHQTTNAPRNQLWYTSPPASRPVSNISKADMELVMSEYNRRRRNKDLWD